MAAMSVEVMDPKPQILLSARLRAWAELARLPNCFTAMADPLAGALIAGAGWWSVFDIIALMLAAACLYTGGIILNDWHDYRKDLQERPERPLPSKRIPRWQGLVGAIAAFAIGLLAATVAGGPAGRVALVLFVAILMYDVILKEVPIAPAFMGLCRALNLLMGMAVVPVSESPIDPWMRTFLCGVMGVYVTGLTFFARREARPDQSVRLFVAAAVTVSPLLVLCLSRLMFPQQATAAGGLVWAGLLLAAVGYTMTRAVMSPQPASVQFAVKTAVLGIVVLDAAMVAFVAPIAASVLVLVLLAPAIWLGRWLYTT
jgi:4-hydroxybenzoate polyprenyltransferase